jgi:NAD(P)-dependent dehydrogenase (short-subunit alcohol dehydrogenase family)
MDLTGRTVAVVGAAQGHGTASALRLAADGADVVLIDSDKEGLDGIAARITRRGQKARVIQARPDDPGELAEAARDLGARAPALHGLVTNHICLAWGTVEQLDIEAYAKVVHYVLVGPTASVKAFLPLLKAAGGSSVVHIGSVDGLFGNPLSVGYSAAKGGLGPLTHIMAREFAPYDIRVNTVATGQTNVVTAEQIAGGRYTDTAPSLTATAASPGSARYAPGPWYFEQLSKATPLKRSGPPEEWGGMVSFLISPDGSYVSGQVHVVDCGRTGLTPGTFPWQSPSTV